MTPSPRKIYRIPRVFTGLGVLLLLAACASLPPPSERIERAELAIEAAREVRADQLSAEEFDRAGRQLAAARAAADGRDAARAVELAELAEVNADLSRARARAAAWRQEVAEKSAANEQLRRNLDAGGGR